MEPFYSRTDLELSTHGPVIAKLQRAFGYIQQAVDAEIGNDTRTATHVDENGKEWHVFVTWVPDVQELVVVFQGPPMDPVAAAHDDDLVSVPLLEKYMPNAQVYAPFMNVYTHLVRAITKGRPFIELVTSMSGTTPPRRIVLTGMHTGAAIATIATPCVQILYPAANVRCCTFGSPRVGNRTFAHAVQWLAQISYRTVLPSDPVPEGLLPEGLLVHVEHVVVLGHRDFAAATLLHRQHRGSKSESHIDPAVADDAHAMHMYAAALDVAQLVPTPIKDTLMDKALATVPVERLESLFFGKPTPLKKQTSIQEVWLEGSGSRSIGGGSLTHSASQVSDEQQGGEEALLTHIEAQLGSAPVDVATGAGVEDAAPVRAVLLEQQHAEEQCMQSIQQTFAHGGNTRGDDAGEASFHGQQAGGQAVNNDGEKKQEEGVSGGEQVMDDSHDSVDWDEGLYDIMPGDDGSVMDGESQQGEEALGDGGAAEWYDGSVSAEEQQLGMLLMRHKVWQALYVAKGAYYQDPQKFARCCGVKPDAARVMWVAWHNNTLVLTARGTVTVTAIVQDLRFLSRQMPWLPYFPNARTHMGILDSVLALTVGGSDGSPSKLQNAIDQVVPDGVVPQYILATGHSLGAGVAQLVAMWAAIKFPLADVRVVTFGAPRIGNLHYREAFMMLVGNSIRVVNRRDSLVKLPPSVRSSHYTHVDTCLWLNKHMTVLGHGRPSNVEATAFNNFEHYLYAYLHAVAVLLPCPRGLDDLDQPCPEEDAKSFNSKIKAQVQALRAARAAKKEKKGGVGGVIGVVGQVAKVPLGIVGGAVGAVGHGVRGLARTVTGEGKTTEGKDKLGEQGG